MNEKYDILHKMILCILHEILFGEYNLRGDANERLLSRWYSQYSVVIENEVERIIKIGR